MVSIRIVDCAYTVCKKNQPIWYPLVFLKPQLCNSFGLAKVDRISSQTHQEGTRLLITLAGDSMWNKVAAKVEGLMKLAFISKTKADGFATCPYLNNGQDI